MIDKSRYFSACLIICVTGFILLFIYSCANKGYPEGGPKDLTPPKVISEQPLSYSTNFDKKSINVYFDEFVQLKNVAEKFIISPPQAKKPKVRLKGRYIMVEFADSLKPETTYSLDFADAISDNNESNPLGYYRYVFSTGKTIDSLELSGNVVHAETNEPILNAYVFLYKNTADSVPIKQLPDYMARTDSSGFFRVTNIADTLYKVVTVMDDNRDYKYIPEAERIGFLDTLVRPVVINTIHADTLGKDSVVIRPYQMFGPSNIYLRLFNERLTQLYMVSEERKQREVLSFVFSIPAENDFKIEFLDSLAPQDWYLPEISSGKDTINLWIKDSLVYKRDTLIFKLSYLRSDSTRQQVLYTDTTKYVFTDKKQPDRKKKKDKEEKPVIEFLKMEPRISGEQRLKTEIVIEFDRPVLEDGLKNIRLTEKTDSLFYPTEYKLRRDSMKLRRYYLEKDWIPEREYALEVDSAAIVDIYGHHNNKYEKKFKARSLESYGKVILNVTEVDTPLIVQIYKADVKKDDKGDKAFTIVGEKTIEKDGEVIFELLDEGKYKIRAISDGNRNGKWDTGLYLKRIQPEVVRYLPAEVNVKQNFDIDQEFNLKNTHTIIIEKKEKEEKKEKGKSGNRTPASSVQESGGDKTRTSGELNREKIGSMKAVQVKSDKK